MMSFVFKKIFEWIGCSILFLMGWHHPPDHVFGSIRSRKRNQILLLQHTSYWDFPIAVFYIMAQGLTSRVKYIVNNEIKEKYWFILPLFKLTGCIFVPPVETKNQGTTQGVIDAINADPTENKIIFLGPNGSVKGSTQPDWRTGWYYIAKGIQADVGTSGLNYHPLVRSAQVGEKWYSPSDTPLEDLVTLLKLDVSKIYPKFPQESSVPVTYKYPSNIFLPVAPLEKENEPLVQTPSIDLVFLLPLIMNAIVLWGLWDSNKDMFLLVFLVGICSAKYHFNYEQDKVWSFLDTTLLCFTSLYFQFKLYNVTFRSWSELAVLFVMNIVNNLSIMYYYLHGFPERSSLYRSSNYIKICMGAHTMWLLNILLYAGKIRNFF